MKLHSLVTAALVAASLAACQPAPSADTTTEAPVAEAPAPESPAASIPANCAALAHRNWEAEVGGGASPTLTISGEADLPTPGYSVSLARDPSEASDAAQALLTLNLAPPSGIVAQVVTATPIYYFGPGKPSYASVRIACGDGELAVIALSSAP